jgi:hypothetical protein
VNGELAQLICLASYGSGWFNDGGTGPAPDLTGNSTFKYVRSTEFSRAGREAILGTQAWFGELRERGIQRVWLAQPDVLPVRSRWPYLEPHLEVAFANGGHWFLLATGPAPAEVWRASWSVIEPRPADNRIWLVRYAGTLAEEEAPHQLELARAAAALDAALTDAREFARRAGEPDWANQFTDAIETDDDRPSYQPDLMDPAFPGEARRLIAKASRAWVFGGMGSWNDLGFADDAIRAEHADISRLLFATLMQACLAAVNCELPQNLE